MNDDQRRLTGDLGTALRDLLTFHDWPHDRREGCSCQHCYGWDVVDRWQATLPTFDDVRGILVENDDPSSDATPGPSIPYVDALPVPADECDHESVILCPSDEGFPKDGWLCARCSTPFAPFPYRGTA